MPKEWEFIVPDESGKVGRLIKEGHGHGAG